VSGGGDGPSRRRLGRQPERAEQAPHGLRLGHRVQDPARPGTAGTDEDLDREHAAEERGPGQPTRRPRGFGASRLGVGACDHQGARVDVDHSLSLGEKIAKGKFDLTPFEAETSLPRTLSTERKVRLDLRSSSRALKSSEALEMLQRANFRPATLEELLAFGSKHPNVQRESRVVALGTVGRDNLVAYLSGSPSHRTLMTTTGGGWWPARTKFLAVPLSAVTETDSL
jgi:hypothetical protein